VLGSARQSLAVLGGAQQCSTVLSKAGQCWAVHYDFSKGQTDRRY